MTTTAQATTVATLITITDLRPIDWVSGKRVPIHTDEMAECHRCGRRHAIVWTVEVVADGQAPKVFDVGSRCGARMVSEGLLPELDPASVKAAKKSARQVAREARQAEVEQHARRVGEALRRMHAPKIERTRCRWDKYASGIQLDEWDCDGQKSTCPTGTDMSSVRAALLRRWHEIQATAMIATVPASLVANVADRRTFAAAAAVYASGGDAKAYIEKW